MVIGLNTTEFNRSRKVLQNLLLDVFFVHEEWSADLEVNQIDFVGKFTRANHKVRWLDVSMNVPFRVKVLYSLQSLDTYH